MWGRFRVGNKLACLLGIAGALAVPAGASAAVTSAYVAAETSGFVAQLNIAADGVLSPKSQLTAPASSEVFRIAITPDGRHLYATISGSTGKVYQYDIGPGGLLTPMSPAFVAAGQFAQGIALSPDGKSVYVADSGEAMLLEYDIGPTGMLTPKAAPSIATGAHPTAVAITPNGANVYVADENDDNVAQFSVGAGGELSALGTPVTTGANPVDVGVSPDGKSVYVVGSGVSQFDVGSSGALSPKSPPSVPTTGSTSALAITPDGRNLYVAGNSGSKIEAYAIGAGGLLTATGSPSTGPSPQSVAVSPDGRNVYTANISSAVSVSQFDIGPGGVPVAKSAPNIALATTNEGIAFPPDQGPVAALSATAAPPGSATTFSGSGSSDPDGSITRYDWNFGDGTTATNGGATPTHVYANPGSYHVTLTVTDDAGCSATLVFTGQTAYCNGGPQAVASQIVTITAPAVVPPAPALRISGLRLSARTFVATGRLVGHRCAKASRANRRHKHCRLPVAIGGSYSLSRAGSVTITLQRILAGRLVARRCVAPSHRNRKSPRCQRAVTVAGSLLQAGSAGVNSFSFTGRFGHGALPAGSYRLIATAVGGTAATSMFSIRA